MNNILGIPCRLRTPAARAALAAVLRQIRGRRPADFARLCVAVTEVRPLPRSDARRGVRGRWEPDSLPGWPDVESPGVVLVHETAEQLRGLIAHELGHACTTRGDLDRLRMPVNDDEWMSEVAADWYAYRWGFGRIIAVSRRTRSLAHHGPGPGQVVEIELLDQLFRFRLTRRFVFRPVPSDR